MCIDNPMDVKQECLECEQHPEKCMGQLPGKLRPETCIKNKEE